MSKQKKTAVSPGKTVPTKLAELFVLELLRWNKKTNNRVMPWKGEKDPYKIWLSEVILQQTRVEQGLKYYENFIREFPDVFALAAAREAKVYKLWEGLGYYSRCKNLMITAKFIARDLSGFFPKEHHTLMELKGVGSYTASAIASFAYNLPYAVLDGNVFRVLSRVFNISIPIDNSKGRNFFSGLAQNLLPEKKAAQYNQAIMDFGAVVCKPHPECNICFFSLHCEAFLSGRQDVLPAKEKKQKIRERWFNYIIVKYKGQVLVHQRTTKDIWQQLFEFILVETVRPVSVKQVLKSAEKQFGISDYKFQKSYHYKQKLSHQTIHFSFLEVEIKSKTEVFGFSWIKISELKKYAFPKTLQEFVTQQLK